MTLPPLLQPEAEAALAQLHSVDLNALAQHQLTTEALAVLGCSQFVARSLARTPGLLAELLESGDLLQSGSYEDSANRLTSLLLPVQNEAELQQQLRRFRQRQMVRLAWRDLSHRAGLNETMQQTSDLADIIVTAAQQWLDNSLRPQWGTPLGSDSQPLSMVIIGMGKLGAGELNFSSDIDLIFAYPEEGETVFGRRALTHQEYFIKLGQKLIQALAKQTAEGFVYRVDMRLRPFGDAGPLVLSFDAMEHYYQSHGREWERYAMLKARVLSPKGPVGEELMARIHPFIYRKYIDFGAFESLREMKAMIAAEVHKKGADRNVKLGAGGIREIEFIGQAFQLIRGGREPALQTRRILSVLEVLRGFNILPDYVATYLTNDYIFLRQVENRLQEYDDRQTHLLPKEEAGQQRLAWSMSFESWESFYAELQRRMRRVHQNFEQVFAAPQSETQPPEEHRADHPWHSLWRDSGDNDTALAQMAAAGYHHSEESLRLLRQWQQSRAVIQLQNRAQQRLNQLMPLLLGAVAETASPDHTLKRLLEILQQIVRRSTYLALLVENPLALSQLVKLCHASPWIATTVATYPQLMDSLLDPRLLYEPLQRHALINELHTRLNSVEDEEMQLEELRRFKQTNLLRVAAADIMEAIPLMQVSDYLTDIAEALVNSAVELAVARLTQRHGLPQDMTQSHGFGVIAYGKFGGIELGYGSDLDLVFLHRSGATVTVGEKPLDVSTWYARAAQRLISLLTTRTFGGVLYEIDTRLRPNGASGLMVNSLSAYRDYLHKDAWTWEHQALVRARFVAGDAQIKAQFNQLRHQILTQPRQESPLRQAVLTMRQKMRQALAKDSESDFDLKQGVGGITDIEFIVQYLILRHASCVPELTQFSDNIRSLEQLTAAGLLTVADSSALIDIYRRYRARAHRNALQQQQAVVANGEFSAEREEVSRQWQQQLQP